MKYLAPLLATITAICLCAGPTAVAQKPVHERAKTQYKRIHQSVVFHIYKGELDKARAIVDAFLKNEPSDVESLFMHAVIEAHAGNHDKAHADIARALDAGLPIGRITAEANNLLAPLEGMDRYTRADTIIAHGPMAGHISPSSVQVWVRTAEPAEIIVEAYDVGRYGANFDAIYTSVSSTAITDFTGKAVLKGLTPGRPYRYIVTAKSASGQAQREGTFTTLPEQSKPATFTIAFGGGAGYVPQHEHMWVTVAAEKPLAFLFLGDNIYPDAPELREMQRYSYYRRQSGEAYRQFIAATPLWAIWDDHDFATNDSWGGPDLNDPPWKESVWNVFRQNWANPAFGGGEGVRGCWFQASIADVEFFFLDSRYYRTDPSEASPSMLGPVQRDWLTEGLRDSKATFKIICSPVPFTKGTKGDSPDTWDGYDEERDQILRTIRGSKIDGVFVLSADRHRSDVWRMDEPEIYPIYELESSRLTNQHVHEKQPGALFSYNESQSFGRLDFDTTIEDPTVTYTIINIDGEKIHQHQIKHSEISFK